MINITAQSSNDAWHKTLRALAEHATDTGNQKYWRDELTLIEIGNPGVIPADPRFPMSQVDLDIINRYIYTGESEEKVVHEWTKIYYHRAFDQPNSQIEFLISRLNEETPVPEAQISIWDKNIDQDQEIQPCTQIIWARIKHGKVECHVHTNSSDAYKKLLMNMLEFISLHHYIANRVGKPVGTYYHFLDSCHIYAKDKNTVTELLGEL